jgi:hypothetical protein
MRSLFSVTRDTPGVCSPSRRVVSKNFMVLGKRLNKAIPHLNHVSFQGGKHKYKNYGVAINGNNFSNGEFINVHSPVQYFLPLLPDEKRGAALLSMNKD